MAQLCTNAPPITNSALNGSHLHECLLTHSECTQPTEMKWSPYKLKMHWTNSNQVLPLHTQNALNQLKSRALLTHSQCTQPTQIKCSPYTLRMHSTNWNQGLSLHTQNALSQLKWNALLTHSQCTQPTQIKTYNAGMWTHAHPMLRNTSKEHQSSLCAPPNSRWPPNSLKLLQGSKSASKNPPELKLALATNTKPQDLS
jgi:hypothetical protein